MSFTKTLAAGLVILMCYLIGMLLTVLIASVAV